MAVRIMLVRLQRGFRKLFSAMTLDLDSRKSPVP